jgi:hypothetical protein
MGNTYIWFFSQTLQPEGIKVMLNVESCHVCGKVKIDFA